MQATRIYRSKPLLGTREEKVIVIRGAPVDNSFADQSQFWQQSSFNPEVTFNTLTGAQKGGGALGNDLVGQAFGLYDSMGGISGIRGLGAGILSAFAEREIGSSSSEVLLNTSRHLQAKFKHPADFGIEGNFSKANVGKFSSAINQHINSEGVQAVNGTYRGQSVVHYLNPNTDLNAISSLSKQFISSWKLNPAQFQNVLKPGGL